jgi:hypothetical protein
MQQAPGGRLFAALDTSVLINFLRLGRLDLLTDHSDWRFVVTDHVVSEVLETTQQNALSHALSQAQIDLIFVSEQSELERFAQLNTFLGKGESAAIAVAENRDWLIAMDVPGLTQVQRSQLSRSMPNPQNNHSYPLALDITNHPVISYPIPPIRTPSISLN